MKHLLLPAIACSVLFFQCEASEQTPEEFQFTQITSEYVNEYYPGFIKDTENKYKTMNSLLANTAAVLGFIISFGRASKSDTLETLAITYGYNQDARRLLGIGRLILDGNWYNKLDFVKNNYSSETYIAYINDAKDHVFQNLNAEYGTNEALNQTMLNLHFFCVDKTTEELKLDINYAKFLRENSERNEQGLYPMHAYFQQYTEEHNQQVHPYAVWNMFLAYLFALHKVTSKGS